MEGLIKDLKNILSKKKRIAITTHTNPDGDAIGSSLALFLLFKKMDLDVKVITPNQNPDFLNWVPGCDEIIIYENNQKFAGEIINNSDTIGISSGASAPEKLVQTLLDNIKKERKISIEEVVVAEEKVVFKLPKELN